MLKLMMAYGRQNLFVDWYCFSGTKFLSDFLVSTGIQLLMIPNLHGPDYIIGSPTLQCILYSSVYINY
jgi:hypothetical protein